MTLDGRLVRIAAAMVSALALALASGAAVAQSAASFIVAIGSVQVIDSTGQSRRAERGGALAPGDRVITGADGLAQIRFSDGAMLSVRASSDLRIEAHSFRGEADTLATTVLQLLRGGLRAITGAVARVNRSGYKVVTATATIGVRGTDFEAFYIPPPTPGGTSPGEPGTYLRVTRGVAFLETRQGILDVQPQQIGFVPVTAAAPRLLPQAPPFILQPPRPAPAPAQPPQRSEGGSGIPTVRQIEPSRTLTAPTLTSPTTSPTLSPEATTISPTLTPPPTTSPTLTAPTTSPTPTSPTTSPTLSPSTTSPVAPSMTAPATSPMLSPNMSPTAPMTAPPR